MFVNPKLIAFSNSIQVLAARQNPGNPKAQIAGLLATACLSWLQGQPRLRVIRDFLTNPQNLDGMAPEEVETLRRAYVPAETEFDRACQKVRSGSSQLA